MTALRGLAAASEDAPYYAIEDIVGEFDAVARPVRAFGRAWYPYDLVMGCWERHSNRSLVRLATEGPRPARILELGTGTGDLTRRLALRFPDAALRAVDYSEGMLRASAERLARRGVRAVLVRENALALSVPDASQDLVVSSFLLDLLPPPAILRALAEVRRVLRPGGAACFAVLTSRPVRGPRAAGAAQAAWFRAMNRFYSAVYRSRAAKALSRALLRGYFTHCRSIDLRWYLDTAGGLRMTALRQTSIRVIGIPVLPVALARVVNT